MEFEIDDRPWFWNRIEDNGKLNEHDTTSEYERGFIDCWNQYVLHDLVRK